MINVKIANNATTRLAAGITSAATTLSVVTGEGAKFPTLATGEWFPATIVDSSGTLEIVKVTARSTDAFTITRAQEGTSASAFSAGDRVELRATAAVFDEYGQSFRSLEVGLAEVVESQTELAETVDELSQTVGDVDAIKVSKTDVGNNGAIVAPEGNDAERPTPGAAGLHVRGSTQDTDDYKPEFWNRVTSMWDAFASRVFVRKSIFDRPVVRQTVISGPLDASGFASFLPSTTSGLSITTQGITSTTPLVVTAGGGFDAFGQVDRSGSTVANLTWGSLAASAVNYLYVDISAGGALTPGSTTLAPAFREAGANSPTAGQYTFNISEMRGVLGDGTTAAQVYRVFVGEATTGGVAVTSSRAYAYQGRYVGSFTPTLFGSLTSRNHNIGVAPRKYTLDFMCTTANGEYSVGDVTDRFLARDTNTIDAALTLVVNERTIAGNVSNSSSPVYYGREKVSGASFQPVLTSWAYRFNCERGW